MKNKTIQDKHNLMLIARFKQIIAVTLIFLTIIIISTAFLNFSSNTIGILVCDFIIMCLLFFLAKKDRVELAKQLYLWVNLLIACYVVWKNGGLISSGLILVFPIILMTSALVSSTKTFYAVFSSIIIFIAMMGVATINDWKVPIASEFGYWHLIMTLIMLSASGYTAWRFNGDMQYALKKLRMEVENVNKSRSEIERLIHDDPLTGLSSKLDCIQKYHLLKENSHNTIDELSFLSIDIDNFKSINDYYNHSIGDELLKKVAIQLNSLISLGDITCRLSGDEFLIVISRPKNYNLEQLSEKILKRLSRPIDISEYKIEITISIGAATQSNSTEDFENILKRADLAMHRAKQSGKNQYSFYDDEILEQSTRKLEITNGLKAALKNDDLELFLQPKVDIVSGKITSAEALIRWVGNNPKNFSPAEFIPLIESTELICSIGEWVISNACRLCKELHDNGFEKLSVSVNISAAQFARGGLEKIIIDELQKSQLPPEFLELELTEHILFQDDEGILDELSRIKDLGLSLSIDDFGTGYSNLGYLTKFKVDYLKIDRSFITEIHKLPENIAIVDAIIKMANTLGLKVVAEGVETEQEWSVLKKLNCDLGQGFLWSKPVPSKDFLKLTSESV